MAYKKKSILKKAGKKNKSVKKSIKKTAKPSILKELFENTSEYLDTLFENATIGIAILDPIGKI